jgi:hypothetical protein
MSSNPARTAAWTKSRAVPSQESSASTSRRNSRSSIQAPSRMSARSFGAHSAARWNNSSICIQRSGVTLHLRPSHLLVKPRFRHPQVAPYGDSRNIQHLGDLVHGESAEIAEFDGLAFSRVNLL